MGRRPAATSSSGVGAGGPDTGSSGSAGSQPEPRAARLLGWLPARPSARRAQCPGSRPREGPGAGRRVPEPLARPHPASGAAALTCLSGDSCRRPPDSWFPPPPPSVSGPGAPRPHADTLSHANPWQQVTPLPSQRGSHRALLPQSAGPAGQQQRTPPPGPPPAFALVGHVNTVPGVSPETWAPLERPRPWAAWPVHWPRPPPHPPRGQTRVHRRPGEGWRPTGRARHPAQTSRGCRGEGSLTRSPW